MQMICWWSKLWQKLICNNNLSQAHSSVFFRLKTVRQVEGSAESCLAEILQEMSVQTSECMKREKLLGFTQAPASPQKSAMNMKQTKKKK